jgi:DnaJ-class molecular chaperone
MVDVKVPSRLSARQRELLEALAAEMGERDAAGAEITARAPGRGGRRKRGLGDRLKDAIS